MPLWNLDQVVGGMPVGSSFFVPCVQCKGMKTRILGVGKRYGVTLRVKVRFENNIKGVRAWRIE